MRNRILIALLSAILVASAAGNTISAQRAPAPPWRVPMPEARSTASITVGTTDLVAELALTSEEQQLGLGYRNGLPPNSGMLFVFQQPAQRTFWMKGMRFCLDIIWIANDEIIGAADSVCPDPDGTQDADRARFDSIDPVTHVLEMPAGWLAEHGYGPGTPIEIPVPLDSTGR